MLNELYAHHGSAIFLGTLICVVLLSAILSLRKKPRKDRPEPPAIFGPIRGMYVCYQCDTVFNTPQCPTCREEATIPLIHLTGSIVQNDRFTAMIDRLQVRSTWTFPTHQDAETDPPAPEPRPEAINDGVYEVH
jgi:hypothetical protein